MIPMARADGPSGRFAALSIPNHADERDNELYNWHRYGGVFVDQPIALTLKFTAMLVLCRQRVRLDIPG